MILQQKLADLLYPPQVSAILMQQLITMPTVSGNGTGASIRDCLDPNPLPANLQEIQPAHFQAFMVARLLANPALWSS